MGAVDQGGPRQRADFVRTTSRGIGASAQATVIVEERGDDTFHKTILSLVNMPVTVGNTTGASFGSKKLYDFPECRYQLVGGNCDLTFDWSAAGANIGQTGSGDAALGSTATADATLSGTDVDHMASTAMLDPFVAGVGTLSGVLVKDTEFDGSATAKDLYLNVIIDDTDVADAESDTIYVSGTIIMVWINYGDH